MFVYLVVVGFFVVGLIVVGLVVVGWVAMSLKRQGVEIWDLKYLRFLAIQ